MKKCTSCKIEKDLSFFGKNGKFVRSTCKECTNRNIVKAQRITRDYVRNLKDKCIVCGYSKCAEALDFHHINGEKEFALGKSKSWSKAMKIKIDKEIEKCVVLCSNCHRELHAGVINLDKYASIAE